VLSKHIARRIVRYRRNGDILMQAWKDKRSVRVLNTINSEHNSVGKRGGQTSEKISNPNCIVQYKYMKGELVFSR